jgi:hypothetical protein
MPEDSSSAPDLSALSPYERRLWMELDRILYQNYLTPRTVTDFWGGDRDAVIAHLRQMKDRVIRSIIIIRYVELDDLLNRIITQHFFGKGRVGRRGKKHSTLETMLDKLYPQQKLDVIKTFMEVPRDISSHVMALNDLRNSFAHRYNLAKIPKSKRLYKGRHDVFTTNGLEKFGADMWEVDEFFQPEVTSASLDLVKWQRERNAAK